MGSFKVNQQLNPGDAVLLGGSTGACRALDVKTSTFKIQKWSGQTTPLTKSLLCKHEDLNFDT